MGQSPLPERDAASLYVDANGRLLDRYRGCRPFVRFGCYKLQIVFADEVFPGNLKLLSFSFADFRILEV